MFFAGNPAVSFISVSSSQRQQSKHATIQTCITNKETTTCLYIKARNSHPSWTTCETVLKRIGRVIILIYIK